MVWEAATGAAALRALREAKIVDLLLTDIGLGDAITGWDVAEAFRVSRPIAPVIYVSGNPNNDARRVEGSVFLSKPVVISWLLATCRTLVTKHAWGQADHIHDDSLAASILSLIECVSLATWTADCTHRILMNVVI